MLVARSGWTVLMVLAVIAVAGAAYLMIDWAATSAPVPPVPRYDITTIPAQLDRACRRGRAKLYDECSDQLSLFETATTRAAAEGKVPLVSYGAEWCIWCHVFERYIHGETTRFEYTYGSPKAPEARETSTIYERAKQDVTAEAAALSAYVGSSFVVVHIDVQYAPNGHTVMERTGAAQFENGGIPFIFTVDREGRYAAHLDHDTVEVRRDTNDWYRGYDRRRLLAELQRMHAAAVR